MKFEDSNGNLLSVAKTHTLILAHEYCCNYYYVYATFPEFGFIKNQFSSFFMRPIGLEIIVMNCPTSTNVMPT